MLFNQHESITDVATKAGPPVAVSGLSFLGVSLPELVQIVTLVYVVILIGDKVFSIIKTYRNSKKSDESTK